MRNSTFYFIFILLFVFIGGGCFAQEEMKNSFISLLGPAQIQEENSWDFGKVEQGVILEHTFVLKNDSSRVVKITRIDTSCGCTASNVEKDELLPKESTPIKVSFNTKGYLGKVSQYVYVHTDHPDNPVIKLTITAEVVK